MARGQDVEFKMNENLIRRVMQGETTFEETIRPLIEENNNLCLFGRRACYSGLFVVVAEKCRGQFANLLSFRSEHKGSFVDLTAVVDRSKWLRRELISLVAYLLIAGLFLCGCYWLTGGFFVSTKLAFTFMLFGVCIYCIKRVKQYTAYLRRRRDFAEKTLADARFLDTIVATVRNKE